MLTGQIGQRSPVDILGGDFMFARIAAGKFEEIGKSSNVRWQ